MNTDRSTRIKYYIVAGVAFILTFSMVIYPESAFTAAVRGLDVWWNVVFPALLPFFIAAEVLMGIGVVHFMGVLLEPLMRPLFRVPGAGSFVMAVGLASGFPIGSILTAKLRTKDMCSKEEGERLMSFTNTADPLFMFGAVAVGMLSYPQIGYTIAAAHYLSSISVGLLMRFHKPMAPVSGIRRQDKNFILIRASKALIKARTEDTRPFGRLMGDAIRNSVNSLLLIGGFIISLSVIIDLFAASGAISWLGSTLKLSQDYVLLGVNGLLELTLGCQVAAQSGLALTAKIMAIGAIIAWSGLSVHGQVASIISNTDLDIRPYLVARIIHAILAALYTGLLFHFDLIPALGVTTPAFSSLALSAKYVVSTTLLGKVLLAWLSVGVLTLITVMLLKLRLSWFSVKSRL